MSTSSFEREKEFCNVLMCFQNFNTRMILIFDIAFTIGSLFFGL